MAPTTSDLQPLPLGADGHRKAGQYKHVVERLQLLLEGEPDWVTAMATVVCELHHAFEYYHWTGFYRVVHTQATAGHNADSEATSSSCRPLVQGATEPCHNRTNLQRELAIGPYQGHLGCLRIPLSKGVCGAAVRERATQLVQDVSQFPGYIACASSTVSEVVVPVIYQGYVLAVLDIDSDHPAAFDKVGLSSFHDIDPVTGKNISQEGFMDHQDAS